MKLKKFLSFLLSVMLILSVVPMGLFSITASAVTATSGTTGDCTWTLDGTVLTISGQGYMLDDYWNSGYIAPWSGKVITEVIFENGVKNIGANAFQGCNEIVFVKMTDSIITIGKEAFECCSNLRNVIFSKNLKEIEGYAFWGCSNLENIKLPNGITRCGPSAFHYCNSITYVEIPGSLSKIDDYLFTSCSNLKKAKFNSGVKSIDFTDFGDLEEIILPKTVTYLSGIDFYDTNKLEIYYEGSKEEWEKISFGTDCDAIDNVDIVYNYESRSYTPGDLDGDEKITDKDAIYLLMHSYFPDDYPVNQPLDYNNDGLINDKDAIYLLMHCYFPEDYPITK